ncbi:uncharacterized protein LOC131881608 [Tigriopus californicus]|nr:uncharacterized protein LOC131881608 [Tigriopus californicus]XP_059084498.1 uncharacterized protein LOC131881608 [Tigriopus californicus]
MNERPPDPKCVFSRANSSELEFDYGAAISVQCEALSFQGENDSIFDVTGISLNSKLKGDLLQQTLVKNMKTQNKKPVKKCFKKSSSMDEMTVPDGLQLLKEHLGTNQEYYENLRRCYELEGSGPLFPLEPTRSTELLALKTISPSKATVLQSSLSQIGSALSLETGPQRRFSLAKQLAEQVQSKPQNVPEAQGNHPSRLRRAFSEQNLPEEHSLANDNSDDSDEALMDLHTISSFPVRGPKSLRKMKKILKKVLAFEAVLTQLRGKLLSEKVLNPMEDKVDLVQETVMEANTSWSQKGPLKDASIQNVDETTNQTTKISEVPISTETLKNPTSPKQKRPAFNQFLPRIVRNFSPVSRCFHPSLFQLRLEKRLEDSLKALANRTDLSSDEDERDDEFLPRISPSLESKCPSQLPSPSLAYRNLLNGMDQRFFRRIDTSTCLVVPPEYCIPVSQEDLEGLQGQTT